MDNKLELLDNIKSIIYVVREKQVLLDSDVARLYGYETKNIIKAMKRNIERFPENFCFQLTKDEYEKSSRFQSGTLNKNGNKRGGNLKYLPYAFTEQGVAMLSGILKNEIAVEVSIKIMNAFVEMRNFIVNNAIIFEKLNQQDLMLAKHDKDIAKLFESFEKKSELNDKIFYEGQIYDAYSLLIKIIKTETNKIIIIDNYIDNTVLDILSKKNKAVSVMLIGKNNLNLSKLDISKFNEQYPAVKIIKNNKFHDRFIIIDDKNIYHLGASLKDLGKKCFAINVINDRTLFSRISTKQFN